MTDPRRLSPLIPVGRLNDPPGGSSPACLTLRGRRDERDEEEDADNRSASHPDRQGRDGRQGRRLRSCSGALGNRCGSGRISADGAGTRARRPQACRQIAGAAQEALTAQDHGASAEPRASASQSRRLFLRERIVGACAKQRAQQDANCRPVMQRSCGDRRKAPQRRRGQNR